MAAIECHFEGVDNFVDPGDAVVPGDVADSGGPGGAGLVDGDIADCPRMACYPWMAFAKVR